MTLQEKAIYLAGFVDGEGYIGINVGRKGAHNCTNNYKLRFCITNTKTEVLDWVVENFGGAYYARSRKAINANRHAISYQWHSGCDFAGNVIALIEPYLIVKKQQAILALKYRELQKLDRKTCPGTCKFPEALRIEIAQMFKQLNHRGPESVTTNTPDFNDLLKKIESELTGNRERRISDDLSVKREQVSFNVLCNN
jgi:hypothetical protein